MISIDDVSYVIMVNKQTKYKTLYIDVSKLNEYIIDTIIKKINIINNKLNNNENK